ncbi:uncharacterized protein DUF2752 [Stackebrandtia albiflava]|uniref:Uncharacterized protein DUF2752 n=1 Tax=Stackebrandtia albiflava TaxID=406432 RepID=A0A562V135_9ACTN|nr:DUF2752 domain-containing protein [Stackebrandtia albiflava]TWJ11619.1 uncharacterized protein DUF2752 [Stackebrandtia albiflava]
MFTAIDAAATRWRQRFPLLEPAGVLAVATATVVFVGLNDPNAPGNYPTCPFLAMTGYYCPGCGSLRAIHALAHLDLGTALRLNLLTVLVMLPLAAFYYFRWAGERLLGRPLRRNLAHPAWIWAFLVLILGFWLTRNLPFAAILAPYGIAP